MTTTATTQNHTRLNGTQAAQNGQGVSADTPRVNGPENGFAVATTATPKPRSRPKDDGEYAKFTQRMIRAYARRAIAGDPWVVGDMMKLQDELETAIGNAVRTLHDDGGWSWAQIGYELNMTRNAVAKRWGR